MEFLQILLGVFGIILLIVLIILVVRLIFTLNKVDAILDDINQKLKSVQSIFDVASKVSTSISLVNDRLVNTISTVLFNLISKIKKKKESEEEF